MEFGEDYLLQKIDERIGETTGSHRLRQRAHQPLLGGPENCVG